MISDLHIHTVFSCDSKTTMAEYCEEAIHQGVKYLCFTDHVDYNQNDYGYGFYKPQAYFEEFNRIQDKYSDKITILSGIEFSEPHVYQKEFEELSKLPYDFILGSIHYWIDDLFASQMVAKGITLEEAFEKYWIEVNKAVTCGGFDSLAHMDFPKRYYKDSLWNEDVICDIFKVMVKNNISLEINTSSLRKGLSETMPNRELLRIYEMVAGRNVTIGSDSHSTNELAKGYSEAIEMLTPALVNGFYKNRNFTTFY
jgi:histidinol-phosphatase (PHP family)